MGEGIIMNNEKLLDIGKKLGLEKQDIDSILNSKVTNCVFAVLPVLSYIYKEGSYYGTISFYDF
jgi:hypothetical protein